MAFGMRHWIGLTAVGVVLVSTELLPPQGPRWTEWDVRLEKTHAESRYDALRDEDMALRFLLQRRAWADSLSALAVASALDGVAVGAPAEQVPADDVETLRTAVMSEVRAGRMPRSDVVLGVYVQPRNIAATDDATQRDQRVSQEVYVGRRDGRTYCLSVLVTPSRRALDALRSNGPWAGTWVRRRVPGVAARTNIVGACNMVLRHGHPGPHVMTWLENGGITYAAAPATLPMPADVEMWRGRRMLFGLRMGPWFGGERMAYDRCRAGIRDGCAETFLQPSANSLQKGARTMVEGSELVGTSFQQFQTAFGPLDDYILADLEEEFGPERFQRFWTSDRPVAEAFQAAFGMDAGTWMTSWARTNLNVREPGPGIPGGTLFGSVLLLAACAAGAGLWGRRRQLA